MNWELIAMNWELIAIAAALLSVVTTAVFAYRRYQYWKQEGTKFADAGYNSPPAGWFARVIRGLGGYYQTFRNVGPVQTVNQAELNKNRRYLIVLNHQTERDALTMLYVLGRKKSRYMIALSQLFGIRAAIAAWTGAIAVDHKNNPSASARKAIRCLQSERDTSLVVFPQGKLVPDNTLRREDFFDGALMIGKHAHKKSEQPFYVLPAAIHYDRDPKHRTLLHWFLNLIGFRNFRNWENDVTCRATVVFGTGIHMEEMPDGLTEGTDRIFSEIVTLSDQAKQTNDDHFNRPRPWFLRPFTFIKGVYDGFFAHEIMTRAYAVAFAAMLATVPLLALTVSVAVQFLPNLSTGDNQSETVGIGNLTVGEFESTLKLIVPAEAYKVVHEQIGVLQTQPRLLTISIGLAITFWAASGLYVSIMDALNRIYGTRETRSYLCVRLMAMLMTVLQTGILLGSMLIIVTWPQIQSVLGMDSDFTQTVDLVKWGTIFLMVLLSYSLWFRVGPASQQQRSLITFGGIFGSVAFIAVCIGFRTYVQNFASYERTYGSLGGVMALLLWYWLSSMVLLLAAEINRVIEDMRRPAAH